LNSPGDAYNERPDALRQPTSTDYSTDVMKRIANRRYRGGMRSRSSLRSETYRE
jgi:hypothetical protein